MSKQADLMPPLGQHGGTCKVVERIETQVQTPSLRSDLAEKVEQGEKLTNPEAALIYDMGLPEQGAGIFKALRISAHAQYRMDQRGVTVAHLRQFFANLTRKVNDWKSQRAPEFKRLGEAVQRNGSFEWTDKQTQNLLVAFQFRGQTVDIITTYFVGKPDPRPSTCGLHTKQHVMARSDEDLSGFRTFVKNPQPADSDTGKAEGTDGKYPTQGDPRPDEKGRSKPSPTPVYNLPGESGSNSDGTVHKDKARTKGVPGGQYDGGATHPLPNVTDSKITPNRRPGLTADLASSPEMGVLAGMYPPAYPANRDRRREQRGQAYRYDHKRYLRLRGQIKQRQRRRHTRLRNDYRYQLDRQRRREHPERFKTKSNGGVKTIRERSQRQRDKQALSVMEPIPFYYFAQEQWGALVDVSPNGVVHYEMYGRRYTTDLDTFLEEVVVDEDRLDDLESYLDQVFGYDPSSPDSSEDVDDLDTTFDTWMINKLARVVVASFFREQHPPEVSADAKYDRANNHGEWSRRERSPLQDISEYGGQNDGNPGSRVLPRERRQAALIADIRQGCAPDLGSKARGLRVSLRRVDGASATWLFDVQGSQATPYRVRLQATRKANTKALVKSHVRVSCSCPYWQWQGPEHWAKQGDYLYGKPVGTASRPSTQDPQGQHKACKHVLAVFDHVVSRNWDIPEARGKQARVNQLVARYLLSQEVP